MANMKVSDIIKIMQEIERRYGNIDVVGECEDCTTSNMDIYILTQEKGATECYIEVSSPAVDKEW